MLIIDTREPEEYAGGHVEGAINISPMKFMPGDLPLELADTPKDEEVILYCVSGSRSNVVAHVMRSLGFTNITNGINQGQVERRLRG